MTLEFFVEGVHIWYTDCLWCVDYNKGLRIRIWHWSQRSRSNILIVCLTAHITNSFFIYSTADDWPKVLSLRTLLVRSVQHLVTYTKMFVCMSSFRIRLMTSSLMSTNGVTALEPYIPFIKDYQNFAYGWQISLHLFLISAHN